MNNSVREMEKAIFIYSKRKSIRQFIPFSILFFFMNREYMKEFEDIITDLFNIELNKTKNDKSPIPLITITKTEYDKCIEYFNK